MKQPLRLIFYLLVSCVTGITVTLVIDSIENVTVEKRIRKELEQEVRTAARAFRDASRSSDPSALTEFLKEYSSAALVGKIIAFSPASGPSPEQGSHTFLFTYGEAGVRLDFYIRKHFLKDQLAILDLPELVFGLFTTLVMFASIVFYAEKREQAQALRHHFEAKHEEIRKVLEEQEALALLGRMAATLAHELKTPIATLSNLLQTLPSRLEDAKFTSRFFVLAAEELKRTQQLINNLLVYGKEIDADNSEWVPLQPLLMELSRKNSLRVELAGAPHLFGDRFYLGILFDNILRNSRIAGADMVLVATRQQIKGNVAVFVEDNGKGFPDGADLDSLMRPFVTCMSKGAGLGLYLAGKIAASHDGAIRLYRPIHGAGLEIILPEKRVKLDELT